MEDHHDRALSILEELGARPAAPFFEDGPAGYITDVLARLDVSTRRDTYGNIVAHYSGTTDSSQPPVAFVAHMDHPGFELVSRDDDGVFTARALGGVPAASLKKPTRALVLAADGSRVPAELVPIASPTPKHAAERLVTARVRPDVSFDLPAPVVFDLPDFELDGDTIRMRALDDLAGCASILAALERLVGDGANADVYAVFTRAEEVGLIGARLVAESGTLPEETLVVSVESSAVIPGVAQGKGPVIRTGDAARTFDAVAELLLIAARESIREREPGSSCQRQLMSGGTCEATAFGAFGYSVTGVAFPLGNYHNATTSIPDPDGGVGAEYINLSDYLGGVDLIAEAATSAAGRDRRQPRWASQAIPDDMRRRLQDTLPAP